MKITIKNLQDKIPVSPKRTKLAILKTLSSERIKKVGEITVCFINDKEIKELNLLYLGQDRPTDCIAFDLSEPKEAGKILADIAVSADAAVRNARIFKTSPAYESYLYVVHGILHILGYDDRTLKQRKLMEEKARRILTSLKIASKTSQTN